MGILDPQATGLSCQKTFIDRSILSHPQVPAGLVFARGMPRTKAETRSDGYWLRDGRKERRNGRGKVLDPYNKWTQAWKTRTHDSTTDVNHGP